MFPSPAAGTARDQGPAVGAQITGRDDGNQDHEWIVSKCPENVSKSSIKIMNTKPRPALGRLVLDGSSGWCSFNVSTSHTSIQACSAQRESYYRFRNYHFCNLLLTDIHSTSLLTFQTSNLTTFQLSNLFQKCLETGETTIPLNNNNHLCSKHTDNSKNT